MLSAGEDHTTFLKQVETAVAHGARGAIAGRWLWKDCIPLEGAATRDRLERAAVPRLREILAVMRAAAGR